MNSNREGVGRILYWALFGGAFVFLLSALGVAYGANFGKAFNQDIPEFVEGALASRYFYDSGLREPFHVFCLKLGLLSFPNQEQAVRIVTVVQTLFCGFGLWLFARSLFGRWIAMVALWLFAANPVVVYYGVSGMRVSAYTGLLLMFAALLWRSFREENLAVAIFAGAVAGCLILTRRYALALVLGGLMLELILAHVDETRRFKDGLKVSFTVVAVASLLFLPELFLHQTPAFRDNINFFRNLEFHGHAGAFRESPPISMFHYVFVDHSLSEVFQVVLTNILHFPSDYLTNFFRGYSWLWPCAWLATAMGLRRPMFFYGAGMAWLSLAPIVFVLHLDQVPFGKGVENRLVLQTFALFLPVILAASAHLILFILSSFGAQNENWQKRLKSWQGALELSDLR